VLVVSVSTICLLSFGTLPAAWYLFLISLLEEEFKDTNEVIRIRQSKDRQHNGQKKKDQPSIYKTLHRTLKIDQHKPH